MSKKYFTEDKAVFDYKLLTDFHPGLVYGFEVESSVQSQDINTFEYFLHGEGQHQDMMNAYLYAQKEILAAIRKTGLSHITSQQILFWINQIHKRITRTLANDLQTTAGEFTQDQVLRWHPSSEIADVIKLCLAGEISTDTALTEAKKIDSNPEIIKQFLELLKKIGPDKSVSLSLNQLGAIPSDIAENRRQVMITMFKLINLFHQDKLTKQQLVLINQVVTISTLPQKIPGLMEKFAGDLLKKWKTCDKDNLDQVAQLAFFAFYNVTEIHPYFNCNGRTATCLMNIILRSLNQPSILMRYPGERHEKDSSYRVAITKITSDPKLLINHIKARLISSTPYENKPLADLVKSRVEVSVALANLSKLLTNTQLNKNYRQWFTDIGFFSTIQQLAQFASFGSSFGTHALVNNYNALMHQLNRPLVSSFAEIPKNNDLDLIGLEYILKQCLLLQQSLANPTKTAATTSVPSSAISSISRLPATNPSHAPVAVPAQYQYNTQEKSAILKKLQSITGQMDWKTFNNNGSTAILLTMNLEQKPLANQIVLALQKTETLQAKLMKEPGSGKPVIKLTAIKIHKLLAVETLSELNSQPDLIDKLAADVSSLR